VVAAASVRGGADSGCLAYSPNDTTVLDRLVPIKRLFDLILTLWWGRRVRPQLLMNE
jgi:hypothetical protein